MRLEPRSPAGQTGDRLGETLDRLRAEGRYRELSVLETPEFSSNDYLGLARSPELAEAVVRAVRTSDRVASTGPRLLSGNAPEWEALEAEFAEFAGMEAALYFGSGYAANVGLLGALLRPEDTVYSDALNHASLIDGIRLSRANTVVFPHLDFDFLEDALTVNAGTGERFIVVESVFSMDGDRSPMDDLIVLAERFGAGLIIDEAHAVGVFGRRGQGLIPDALRSSEPLVAAVYTCGKALASPGAFVAGSGRLKRFLVNKARTFVYSTALPPYVASHVSAALRLSANADGARLRLHERARRLRSGLSNRNVDIGRSDTQIVPLMFGSSQRAVAAAESLTAAGFTVRPIRPPTVPEGTDRIRLTVTADTRPAAIDGLIRAVAGAERP